MSQAALDRLALDRSVVGMHTDERFEPVMTGVWLISQPARLRMHQAQVRQSLLDTGPTAAAVTGSCTVGQPADAGWWRSPTLPRKTTNSEWPRDKRSGEWAALRPEPSYRTRCVPQQRVRLHEQGRGHRLGRECRPNTTSWPST